MGSSGSSSGGKGGGLFESFGNPWGYLFGDTKLGWLDPTSKIMGSVGKSADKAMGTQGQTALDKQATTDAWGEWLTNRNPSGGQAAPTPGQPMPSARRPDPQNYRNDPNKPNQKPESSQAPKRDMRRVTKSTSLMDEDEDE